MKLHNEEYLRANIISSVTLITGSIYFISSWSVSSFNNHFQFCTRTSAYTQRVLYMLQYYVHVTILCTCYNNMCCTYYGILNSCVKK